jgi:integrase
LLVFPPTRGNGLMTGFLSVWKRIVKIGNLLPDITPHVLRHSYASVAADLGYSDSVIGELIGHKSGTTTSACFPCRPITH